jgi:hypothetical protein
MSLSTASSAGLTSLSGILVGSGSASASSVRCQSRRF